MIQRNPRNDTFERVTALRLTGMTYAQIAEAVGVSKQRVGQICGKRDVTKFRRIRRASVKFDGLRNWMNDNHFSMLELCRRLYGDCGGNYMNNLRQKTSGKIDMKKSDIDKLLDITELTYEELFAEVSVCGGERMNGDVMLSIRPEWVEKILSGEKTREIRKTRPKLKTPFRCYIYECGGKVIGEFVCDNIKCITPDSFVVKEDAEKALLGSCLTPKQAKEYAIRKPGTRLSECKDLYSWHISDLVIYDESKELSEFRGRKLVWRGNNHIHIYEKIARPPQSWCYVEELT